MVADKEHRQIRQPVLELEMEQGQGKEMEQQGSGRLGLSYEHQALPEMEAVWYRLEDPTLGVDTPLGTFPPLDCRWRS